MKIKFRILDRLLTSIHRDLDRPHVVALERVGFVSCGVGSCDSKQIVLTARSYYPVEDVDYLSDPRAGAVIGRSAFRKALELSYRNSDCMFHIHRHEHSGVPSFSPIDLREARNFVPDFWHVKPELPHGVVVLSQDSASGLCWYPGLATPVKIAEFWSVGSNTVEI